MNTLCFASDLAPAEWAAWVQAIGTLVAIGFAWWISHRELAAAREQQIADRYASAFQVACGAMLFARTLLGAARGLHAGALSQNADVVGLSFRAIAETLRWFDSIPLTQLPVKSAETLVSCRAIAAHVLWHEGKCEWGHLAAVIKIKKDELETAVLSIDETNRAAFPIPPRV